MKEPPLDEEIDIKEEVIPPFSLDQKVSSYLHMLQLDRDFSLIIKYLLLFSSKSDSMSEYQLKLHEYTSSVL